ncbi:MAG: N-6 DNA methylase [Planctomycetota bacterium]
MFSDFYATYLAEREAIRQQNASEDQVRACFLRFLSAAFPRIRASEINLEQSIQLPSHAPGLSVRHAFADAVYGDLIFEFKRTLDERSRANGESELAKYLDSLGGTLRQLGLLTDGYRVRVYLMRAGPEPAAERLELHDDFFFDPDDADDVFLRLDVYLFHAEHQSPTARDIALRFGDRSPVFAGSFRTLRAAWSQLATDPATRTKYTQWQSIIAIVYGSPLGSEDLFLRHTYLACFARLLAYAALERRAPAAADIPGIINGQAFQQMSLANFVGEDFFTWVSHCAVRQSVDDWLNGLAVRLASSYDLSAINEDLLKSLYQELVDPDTRHDLGEFYTPDWLAERTLREAGFPTEADGRPHLDERNALLDPSCGSGTFLFTAIRILKDAGACGDPLVQFVIRHLAGVDVHPLAITIAKANVVLCLGQELRQATTEVRIPIYMANSLAIARNATVPYISIDVDVDSLAQLTGKSVPKTTLQTAFEIPFSQSRGVYELDSFVDELVAFADPTMDDETAFNGIESALRRLCPQDAEFHMHHWRGNLRLMRWLLKEPPTNTVWRFILQNAVRPQLLSMRRFAFVVGNPPWLSYRFIRSRPYQRDIRGRFSGLVFWTAASQSSLLKWNSGPYSMLLSCGTTSPRAASLRSQCRGAY